MFWEVFFTVWLGTFALWWQFARNRRAVDLGRVANRLLDKSATQQGKTTGRRGPALIPKEDLKTGRFVLHLLARLQLIERLQTLLEQAGLRWKVARLVHGCLALFLAGFVMCWYFPRGLLRAVAVPAALAAGSVPLLYVFRKRRKRLQKFEEQFPDSLEFMARSMRAGHAFSVSVEMLHHEFQEPLSGEFRRTFDEHNLGLPLETALEKLAKRVPSMDVHFFVSAVILQKRTGGNLAELLDKLASLIRERFKLRGRIRAISAHGRMTGMALSLIPIAVGLLMFAVNPKYVMFFVNDPTGRWMAGSAVLLQLAGYAVIKKIVSIEV
jgi:tight adherence protein B